jgi:membrane-associated phospholipid phosphatase
MRTKDLVWLVLFILAALLTISLKYLPYLPGDVSGTRLVQALLPESKRWAQLLSSTAAMPWVLVLIAATFGLSWVIAGRRAAWLSLASATGMWLLGKWLGPIIAQPRPSPELVRVAGSFSGSAFPSIFALSYASTVGFLAVLAAVKASGKVRRGIVLICSSLLLLGGLARIDLAAHWPSDVGISYLIGFLWVSLLIRNLMPRE